GDERSTVIFLDVCAVATGYRSRFISSGVAAVGQLAFDYRSERAANARLAYRLKGTWLHVLSALVLILVLAGVGLLANSYVAGWLFVGIAALPAMAVGWYRGELHQLKPLPGSKTIDDALTSDILSL